jgi:hypothetical protein
MHLLYRLLGVQWGYVMNFLPLDVTINTRPCHLQLLEHNYYHDAERSGFFAVLSKIDNKTVQNWFRLDRLPDILSLINPEKDTYISQNDFFKPNRSITNIVRLNLLFVDLDYYNICSFNNLSESQLVGLIFIYCNDNGIPEPSCIISSGRGLYLKWFLNKSIPCAAIPRWNAIQRVLVDLFSEFGADQRAKDASRVLRMETTINNKTGERVQVIWKSDLLYEFENFCLEVLPWDRKSFQNYKHKKKQYNQDHEKRVGHGQTGLRMLGDAQLNWNRLDDLRKLACLRGGISVGMRDIFLFLAACFISWCVPATSLAREIRSLAHEFVPTLSAAEVESYSTTCVQKAIDAYNGKSIEYQGQKIDPRYRFTNQTLIDWLQITGVEERTLGTIISISSAKERDRIRQKERRRAAGAIDRKEYLAASESCRIEAITMHAHGASLRKIASSLGVSKGAVQHWLK